MYLYLSFSYVHACVCMRHFLLFGSGRLVVPLELSERVFYDINCLTAVY